MKLIAHRGNIHGPNEELENNPNQIDKCIELGYYVEIDLRYDELTKNMWLGHDEPQYRIDSDFLQNDKLWCHAKNIDALYGMMVSGVHCFWHQNDAVTLTSKGYLWNYPNTQVTNKSICVLPELQIADTKNCAGICSDFIVRYV